MDTWLSRWAEFNRNHPTWKNRECADCKSRLISTIKNKKLKHTLKEIEIETETFLWPGKTDFARYDLFFFTQISTLHSNRNPLPFIFFLLFSVYLFVGRLFHENKSDFCVSFVVYSFVQILVAFFFFRMLILGNAKISFCIFGQYWIKESWKMWSKAVT